MLKKQTITSDFDVESSLGATMSDCVIILPASYNATFYSPTKPVAMSRFTGVQIDDDGSIWYRCGDELYPASDIGRNIFLSYAEAKRHYELNKRG